MKWKSNWQKQVAWKWTQHAGWKVLNQCKTCTIWWRKTKKFGQRTKEFVKTFCNQQLSMAFVSLNCRFYLNSAACLALIGCCWCFFFFCYPNFIFSCSFSFGALCNLQNNQIVSKNERVKRLRGQSHSIIHNFMSSKCIHSVQNT